MSAFQRFSCPSIFHPSTNRRMYRLLSNGLIGEPCGLPRPSSRLRVLRCLFPRSSVSLHTGMRPSEQYALTWSRVDLVRKLITIPKSKNGNTRHVPLNSIALAAFQELFACSSEQGQVFVNMQGEALKGYKHWFDPALREAGISFFTWYCLRHTFASRLVMAGVDLRTELN
jgi:integrase